LPAVDLTYLSHYLERFSHFKKPIYLDQLSAPSTYRKNWKTGWWHNKWDQEVQAEFLTTVYTIAFSKPYVKSITWFDGSDREPFIESGGLLDKRKNPKASYFALKKLIDSWTTQGKGKTYAKGTLSFRGYAGHYKLTITKGERKETLIVSIKEREYVVCCQFLIWVYTGEVSVL